METMELSRVERAVRRIRIWSKMITHDRGRVEVRTEKGRGGGFMKNTRHTRGTRGQSALEWLLVVGVVLAGIVAVVATAIQPAVTQTVQDSGDAIQAAADNLKTKLNE